MGGDGVEQLLRDLVGIGVQKPHPLLPRCLDGGQPLEQEREAVLKAEVLAIAGGVLADEVDLTDARREQPGGFSHHGLEPPAAEFAAELRDHTEGAGVVAALRDLDVGIVARRGEHARRQIVIQIGHGAIRHRRPVTGGHDFFQLVGADHGVHFGNVAADLIAVALHQATRHHQSFEAAGLLELSHFENGLDRFLLGGVDETARVDDDDLGVLRIRSQLPAVRGELPHHDFGVHQILGAAQADKTDFQGVYPRRSEARLQDTRAGWAPSVHSAPYPRIIVKCVRRACSRS